MDELQRALLGAGQSISIRRGERVLGTFTDEEWGRIRMMSRIKDVDLSAMLLAKAQTGTWDDLLALLKEYDLDFTPTPTSNEKGIALEALAQQLHYPREDTKRQTMQKQDSITKAMREQVLATISNIENNVYPSGLTPHTKQYFYDHLVNLVETCLSIAVSEEVPVAAPDLQATPQALAKRFHETYERLAPSFSYQTREASAVPWEQVPTNNKHLMIAVCRELLQGGVIIVREEKQDEQKDHSTL